MANRLKQYLQDPVLNRLYRAIRQVGRLNPISVDLTHLCNLRCQGCYFYAEQMDRFEAPHEEARFDDFIAAEKARGTNFVTVVGGEPTLVLHRLKKIYDNFWMNVATNGLRRIPMEGFENLPIGIAVWGDHRSDMELRGGGSRDVFAQALQNYRDDPRAFWYYTVAAGRAREVEGVVERCVENGNRVLFNFYGDCSTAGGQLDHRQGFANVRHQVDRMIERYPDKILMTSYLCRVVTTGRLYQRQWGWDVCTSITSDHPVNATRIRNGNPYNPHFRAYNADLVTTRRCCTGESRDCTSCFDVWEHFSWIMSNLRQHLGSKAEFTNWLAVMYLFYLINRVVEFEGGIELLPEIHRRAGRAVEADFPARSFDTSWRAPVSATAASTSVISR